jgi:hypothetical protein
MLSTIAKKLSYDQIVCGANMKWEGFRTKMEAYAEKLMLCEVNDIVICADAYDTLPLRDANEFEQIFKQEFLNQGFSIVSSAETHCISAICKPLTEWQKHHTITTSRRYANVGLICGTAKSMLEFWTYALERNFTDDQIALCSYMNEFPLHTMLDFSNKLLQTTVARQTILPDDQITPGISFIHLPALMAFPLQRQSYSKVLKEIATKLQIEHVLTTQWATRYIPFQADEALIKVLIVLGIVILICIYLTFRLVKK